MKSFDEIYTAQYAKAMRFAYNHCGLKDDMAEQIVSDAFIDLHKALQNNTIIENLTAWLRGTIHMRHAERLRHEHCVKRGGKLTKRQLLAADVGADLAVEHPEFDAVDAADTIQTIWSHLTEMEQKIITMVFIQELSRSQVANQLGITLRTVERRVNRVQNRLRILLSPP